MTGPSPPSVFSYLRRLAADPAAGGVSDAELLRRFVKRRDEAAFELLLWRHAGMVLRVCRGVLLRRRLARRGVALAVALAAGLAPSASPAAPLVGTTLRAGLAFAAGDPTAAGLVSPHVLRITQGVFQAMSCCKLKFTLFLLL